MHHFSRLDADPLRPLCAEGVQLSDIAAEVGTPCYVYSRATLERHYRVLDESLQGVAHMVCYAVKACSNIAILQLLARLGSGFDIVSGGELQRVLRAGGDPRKVVYSGVGKQADEIAQALRVRIHCLNVESEGELHTIEQVAAGLGVRAPVSIRVNPEVDPKTHKYVATGLKSSKFGVTPEVAERLYHAADRSPHLRVVGIDCHIGSQILELDPFAEAVGRVIELAERLRGQGIAIEHLDVGGGLGIVYQDEEPALPHELGAAVVAIARRHQFKVIIEPGRVLVGNAGLLLTRVVGTKTQGNKQFVIVDAAMNDLIRPSLYGAWHRIEPVHLHAGRPLQHVDVVGPVCESGDFLAQDRALPAMQPGDLVAVFGAGAYGFSMASNYNSRPRAAEVLADGEVYTLIRARETVQDLWRGELLLG
ncbi:MAG: diaminopimelate decarboxylase [Deltaproteobacteria bacterium]|nr:diaminopimelate decarboxylase [Deltaproteobacteria bacterium]